jgi:hypothetical protein
MLIPRGGSQETLAGAGLGVRLGLVFALVVANAFFVAAEFALVAVRRSRIDELAQRGDSGAKIVKAALAKLDRYISATQLGITLASLALGWVGEPALASLIDGIFIRFGVEAPTGVAHSAAAITVGFLIITFLHIVLGELAPKSIALAKPEGVSKFIARPLMLFSTIAYPGIWFLNGAANFLLRIFGIQPASERERVHSADELRLLVMQASEQGALNWRLTRRWTKSGTSSERSGTRAIPYIRKAWMTSPAFSWPRISGCTITKSRSHSRIMCVPRCTYRTIVRLSECWTISESGARTWPSCSTNSVEPRGS